MCENIKVAIYSRKSRFTGKGESVENQIEMCRQYVRLNIGETAAEKALVYEDEGFSGGTLDRPQFKKMMAEAERKAFNMVVVYRLDRISRNIGDFAKLIEDLEKKGIAFVSIKEQFDTSSPMGRAMMYISSVFSQLERETIAERIRDNMHELSKTGRWLGGVTPTGYVSENISKVTIDGKVKSLCKLKIVPREAELVKTIFDKFIETGSLTQTESFLLNSGYKTKNGKQFTRFTIKGILTNPVYMKADDEAYEYLTGLGVELFAEERDFDGQRGIMPYNRTSQQKGRTNKIKPLEEWIVSVGKHEGLVSGKKWIKVQKMLALNSSKTQGKPRSSTAILSGMLVCGECGGYMRAKSTGRTDDFGNKTYIYMCSLKEKSRRNLCRIKNVDGNDLDKGVIKVIKDIPYSKKAVLKYLEENREYFLKKSDNMGEKEKFKRKIMELDNEIELLVKVLGRAKDTSAEEYIIKHIDELHKKADFLKMEMLLLEEKNEKECDGTDVSEFIRFEKIIGTMTTEQKRDVIRSLVQEVIWDGEKAEVFLYGSGETNR